MNDEGEAIVATINANAGPRNLMHRKDKKDVEADAADATVNDESQIMLPREAQGRIGQHLRRIYGEILSEPLPDKFSQLLDNLAKTERSE